MDNGFYRTQDLYLAAFLALNGIKFRETTVTRSDFQSVVVFYYENCELLEDTIREYFEEKQRVEPISFMSKIKQLRHFVRNEIRNAHVR